MPDHEFIVKTMEVDWFVPIFSGVQLTGEFFINGSVRISGQAVLSTKGNAEPQPDTTTANFHGGTPPRLDVHFANFGAQSLPLFRDVILNDWKGFTIFFGNEQLDPNSTEEVSVAFKKVRFYRTF